MSMARQFLKYCSGHEIPLDPTLKFSLSYSTNIPRQRGLSGSSAIVCGALNCLIAFYKISDLQLPVNHRPGLLLGAEEALGITAGLQDRVIQVYGGLVSMDFSEYNSKSSFPLCRSLDPGLLPSTPPLILIYSPHEAPGKDSGSVHSQFKEKWTFGDSIIHAQMKEVADLVPQGIAALENEDLQKLARLLKRNFQLRKSMFGEAALGKESLKMIEIADSVAVAAKFTGSGGAVVALPLNEEQKRNLEEASWKAGFVCMPVSAGPVYHVI
jgi:glucuronokinase